MKSTNFTRINLKKIAIVITFNIVISILSLYPVANASSLQYEKGGIELWTNTTDGNNLYNSVKDSLPKLPGNTIPPSSLKGYPLNFRLWFQKGLLVYGNYNSVKDRNQFKLGTQFLPGVIIQNDGYYYGTDAYSGQSGRGEWRYHGIDVSGNLFSNINFIDDDSGIKFNERGWIKRPWDNLPSSQRPNISDYNYIALNLNGNTPIQTQASLQQWINKSLPDGVPLKSKPADPEVYKYLNILSAPTSMLPGQGRMWHEKEDGSIWYQTLSVPILKESLENLPVTVAIYCTNPEADLMIGDPGAGKDSQKITLRFKVIATLEDEKDGKKLYSDPIEKTKYYTRNDINYWTITFDETQTLDKVSTLENKGIAEFTKTVTYGYLRSKGWSEFVTATAQPAYKNTLRGNIGHGSLELPFNRVPLPEPPISINPVIFSPDNNIPEAAFEDVPFHPTDNSDASVIKERRVYVDGLEVDDSLFFSGSYVFNAGNLGTNGRFAVVEVDYVIEGLPLKPGDKACTTDFVYIYPTKPIANFKISSNTWKQNRKIKAEDTSTIGNIQLVAENFPIVQYEWTFGGDTSQIKFGTNTSGMKEFICKNPGIYSATLRCKNILGKWSDPYTVQFEVLEDIAPAICLSLTDSVASRNEAIKAWYYNVCSTDGDIIKTSSIELWYDTDNNGSVDTKLCTWSGLEDFPSYTPTKLGYYKYIVKAQEDIVSDTFLGLITESDKKSSTCEVEWWADNLRPMSDLYINLPIQRPAVDVYFMLDKNLTQAKTDYVSANRMNIANWLIGKNIIPNVQIWDMKTYIYSQPASTSVHTGSSYPSSSITYTSNGYSGTISRTSVSNNRYSRDEGYYGTAAESRYFTATVTNTRTWTKNKWGIVYGSWSHSDYGSSYYISQDGYSGTIPRTGTSYSPSDFSSYSVGASGIQTATGTYGGTLTKQVQVWVPNIVWYNDYTGYYSGTIYKNVRQNYSDPFNPTSIKYVVYISDNTISELNDLKMVMGYAKAAKLVLAGTNEIKTQIGYDMHFDVSGKTIDRVTDSILQYIGDSCPATEKYCVLQNQPFTLNTGNLDLEGDPITVEELQYVHDPTYFDNPTGNEPGAVLSYSSSTGWTNALKNSFANTGLYSIYRRIKDNPSADPGFSQYAYYSGATKLEIYVHRKPIAQAVLDWDYDAANNIYITNWVDKSYDPDHQYNRPDKGIVERSIMWRQSGGDWNYGIPGSLAPGTYELQYYVKDPEETWSDPFIMNFTLSSTPSMQFSANLKTVDDAFSLSSVPASESLEAFDLWTRYPFNVRLDMALYNDSLSAAPLKSVVYNQTTGTKQGNDINWNNITYKIPDTLPDKAYDFRISAEGDFGQNAVKSFIVNVFTPINLEPEMPVKVVNGAKCSIAASTTKYVNSTKVTLFYGTSWQTTLDMTGYQEGNSKYWGVDYTIPAAIPAGTYTARFQSNTANGNIETRNLTFTSEDFRITGVTIEGSWNHWRGQMDIFGTQLSNEPHRFLSLEKVRINVYTTGYADKVVIRFDPGLEAMQYTDLHGYNYNYSDYMGFDVYFPWNSSFELDKTRMDGHVSWEYTLPLAASSKSWENERLRAQYKMTVTVYKGAGTLSYVIDDIDITGNIYDLTYIQPLN